MFVVGMGLIKDGKNIGATIGLGVVGPALMAGAGVPLVCVGYHKKNNAYKKYNEYCAPKQTASSVSLNLQSSKDGIGLALRF